MKININGKNFIKRLDDLADCVESSRPLDAVLTEVQAWIEQNYLYHGLILESVKWKPNSPVWTAKKRQMTGHYAGPGICFGYLAKSFQDNNAIKKINNHHAFIGTRIEYASAVNKERPIIGDSENYINIYKAAFVEALEDLEKN